MTGETTRRLRTRWRATGVFAGAGTVAVAAVVGIHFGRGTAARWGIATATVLTGELLYLRYNLDRNRPGGDLTASLGVATGTTILRGALFAALAGLLAVPGGPSAAPGWLPAALYGGAIGLDAVDGALARRWGRETPLGAHLDIAFDALGILVGIAVGIALGTVPWWYASAGLARYAFLAGVTARKRCGRPVRSLPASRLRRLLAALQMLVVAALLTPVVRPPVATGLATLALVPFLACFWRDWLVVSGRRREPWP